MLAPDGKNDQNYAILSNVCPNFAVVANHLSNLFRLRPLAQYSPPSFLKRRQEEPR